MNRRQCLTAVGVGTVGLAGCAGGDSGGDDVESERSGSREPPGETGGQREGEISNLDMTVALGRSECQFEFTTTGLIHEQAELVIQVYPYQSLLGSSSEPVNAQEGYRETIVESSSSGTRPDDVTVPLSEITDHEFRGETVGFQAIIEIESRSGVNIKDFDTANPVMYYRYGSDQQTGVSTGGALESWETEDGIHYAMCLPVPVSKGDWEHSSDYPEIVRVQSFVNYSIPHDEMTALEEINSGDDPLVYLSYLEPRSSSIGEVEYLNRPIFQKIVESLESTFDLFDITDDIHRVWSGYNAVVRTTRYSQDWEQIENGVAPYPETFFYLGSGDCKAMGLAVNGILHNLGYDTSVFEYTNTETGIVHHMSGGVGMDLDNLIGNRIEDSEYAGYRHPEHFRDDRAENHIAVDPSIGNIGNYAVRNSADAIQFAEGK